MFFDDFNDNSIDTSKWDEYDTATNYIQETGGELVVSGSPGTWTVAMVSKDTTYEFNRPFAVESTYIRTAAGYYGMWGVKDGGTGISYTDFVYAIYPITDNPASLYYYEDGSGTTTGAHINISKWYLFRILVNSTGAKYAYANRDGSNPVYFRNTTYSSENSLRVGFPNYNAPFKLDDFRVGWIGHRGFLEAGDGGV